jgi:hypothetical protein
MLVSQAKSIMGDSLFCPDRLRGLTWPFALAAEPTPVIPYSASILERTRYSHILIHTPGRDAQGAPINLMHLRAAFGMDPAVSEPCLYNQDWYVREGFAHLALDGGWHLVAMRVLEGARAKDPSAIEQGLPSGEGFPAAVTCVFTFLAWWLATGGEKLWRHDFVWCRDRDDNNDRIYVGRYDDPKGLSKSGFSIHRHLALRPAYSAAPEILQ